MHAVSMGNFSPTTTTGSDFCRYDQAERDAIEELLRQSETIALGSPNFDSFKKRMNLFLPGYESSSNGSYLVSFIRTNDVWQRRRSDSEEDSDANAFWSAGATIIRDENPLKDRYVFIFGEHGHLRGRGALIDIHQLQDPLAALLQLRGGDEPVRGLYLSWGQRTQSANNRRHEVAFITGETLKSLNFSPNNSIFDLVGGQQYHDKIGNAGGY